jgi:hypothetical protein
LRSRTLAPAALATIVSIAAGAPAGAQTPAPPPLAADPPTTSPPELVLSDELTTTRWSNAVDRARVAAAPTHQARRVGRLRLMTEDGFPEVYLLLAAHKDEQGRTWVRLRLPQRPNGATGWVRRSMLGPFHVVHTRLVVDRARLRVTLYDRGRRRFRAPVGIGAPDSPTPTGAYWIREKFHVTREPLYGTRAIGTAAYSALSDWPGGGVVGLHGTSQPGLIPGRPSHGCVRLRNADIERLYAMTPIGTPVRIR